jgi:peroxiredoxin
VLGIHTPESAGERNVDNIRRKMTENGIEFPIAVDNDKANWNAWANNMWPSTYLIDKKGYVRYWWYGELNWKGTEGEKMFREKIEELLAESP